MPFELHLATPSDIPRIVEIENASFADSPLIPIIFPNGISPDSESTTRKTLLQQWHDNPTCKHIKVIDTDLDNKIIAFARWFIFLGDHVKFIKTDPNERKNPPGSNAEPSNEFYGTLLKIRVRIIVLAVLCTDPQHQRRGAGRMLLQWGCEIAQKNGIPAYLEASPAGIPLYQKVGFREVERFEMDLVKYGGLGSRINVMMIKYPSPTSNVMATADMPIGA